ncbi:D-alanyl-D-alanine carboxypeptidase family protein [Roseomonas haemaphysalidis]|uniref:D-alanyl-D-alanine carboxypeptidase n=1 Tax=Roseomonas haemaphysalidis TaxID=2768162 RepID=A0ABS3KNC6_9PROT|nr:D-alanyl-D-alanine carboxypeptidase family protein [Roseomonas haemaphysalidis]MBO1078969.1 D-alanyl-D-alanine carboxypeptidase [Roseomonas haemaphysalidis]
MSSHGLARCRAFAFALLAAATISIARPAQAQIGSERYASFVMDANTGETIVSVAADERRYPASLTKMMTLYMAFDAMQRGRLRPDTRIRVTPSAAAQPPSKLGLRAGSTISARDAILAMVTKSANDAASSLGQHLAGGGSEAAFGARMTAMARSLGMRNTVFRNASGLPDPGQYTTARDMARLSQALIRDFPERYAYFSVQSFDWNGRTVYGHNRLLDSYPGADGIKTGFINASGFNLAASAMRNGVRMIAVVFGGASGAERDQHVMALLDRGFDERGTGAPQTDMMMSSRRGPSLVGMAQAAPVIAPAARVQTGGSVRAVVSRPALAAPARPPARAEPGDWAVQVGAFADRAPAQAAAKRAAARGGSTAVERVQVRGSTFWRARVTGLSSAQARTTCRAVRGPCMVLSPNGQ